MHNVVAVFSQCFDGIVVMLCLVEVSFLLLMDLHDRGILDILEDGNISDIEYFSDIETENNLEKVTITPTEMGCDSEPTVDYELQF